MITSITFQLSLSLSLKKFKSQLILLLFRLNATQNPNPIQFQLISIEFISIHFHFYAFFSLISLIFGALNSGGISIERFFFVYTFEKYFQMIFLKILFEIKMFYYWWFFLYPAQWNDRQLNFYRGQKKGGWKMSAENYENDLKRQTWSIGKRAQVRCPKT